MCSFVIMGARRGDLLDLIRLATLFLKRKAFRGCCGVRRVLWGVLILVFWLAGCRWVPGLAAGWERAVALPLLRGLHRLTAAAPFPILEPLALAALLLCLGRHGLRRAGVVVGVYALLWYPAYWAQAPEVRPAADPGQLEALCEELTDRLNGPVPELDGDLPVKAARYPEWMRALGIAGLFSPWTGEVLVNPEVSPAALPFTCVHELTHLSGIADEGAANIAAWRECMRRGGAYAYSARLWALRYALQRLSEADPEACRRALARVDADLARLLVPLPGAGVNPLARLLGIGRLTSDYDALVDFLAAGQSLVK